MKPEEIESIANAVVDECNHALESAPATFIDPATWLLTEASADAIDATLPPWVRVDRTQPVTDDGQISAIFDPDVAALDPAGRALLGLDAKSDGGAS